MVSRVASQFYDNGNSIAAMTMMGMGIGQALFFVCASKTEYLAWLPGILAEKLNHISNHRCNIGNASKILTLEAPKALFDAMQGGYQPNQATWEFQSCREAERCEFKSNP